MTAVIAKQFFDVDALLHLCKDDVTPIPNPQTPGAASIDFTALYSSIMDTYRGLIAKKERSPRFCVAIAIALVHGPANYNAWKWRRDILFEENGETFLKCCLDHSNNNIVDKYFEETGAVAFVTDVKKSIPQLLTDLKNANDDNPDDADEIIGKLLLQSWAPSRQIFADVKDMKYCCCRAAAWELANSRSLAMSFAKGFQAWNHRRDVIELVADRWLDCPAACGGGVPFNAFDERPITESALMNSQKNYHVWLHRTWFLCFFGILFDSKMREKELELTNELIAQDVFNNSAWSHRGFIFRYCLILPSFLKFLKSSKNSSNDDHNEKVKSIWDGRPLRRFPDWLGLKTNPVPKNQTDVQEVAEQETLRSKQGMDLVLAEISWALSQAVAEPRNEAPFTYVSGLVSLVWRANNNNNKNENEKDELISSISDFLKSSLQLVRDFSLESFYEKSREDDSRQEFLPSVRPPRLEPEISAELKRELRPGNTKQQELTHPSLWKDSLVFQILGFLCESSSEKVFNDDDELYQQEAMELGERLASMDPWRKKYWLQEMAMLMMMIRKKKNKACVKKTS